MLCAASTGTTGFRNSGKRGCDTTGAGTLFGAHAETPISRPASASGITLRITCSLPRARFESADQPPRDIGHDVDPVAPRFVGHDPRMSIQSSDLFLVAGV